MCCVFVSSSISVGLDGDLLVALRNLNVIFCFESRGDVAGSLWKGE